MQFSRVLVLGATGRIGGILRAYVGDAGGFRWQSRGRAPSDAKQGDWVICDPLHDPAGLARAAEGCGAILCLSGVTHARLVQDGGADLAQNSDLALAAIRAGAAARARVLLTSSAAVYGAQSGSLAEDAPLRPANAYGAAKVEMEERGAALGAELGVAVTSLRIGNIAGLDAILGGWRPGFRLDRFADGRSPRRSYIGLATLARTLHELPLMEGLPGALNIAEPGVVEMGALLDAAGLAWEAQEAPETAIPEVELDVAALQTLCPWLPDRGEPARMVAEWRAS